MSTCAVVNMIQIHMLAGTLAVGQCIIVKCSQQFLSLACVSQLPAAAECRKPLLFLDQIPTVSWYGQI